jgi:hypothetical protein
MDVYVSTVAREPARSRTDAHADGSTFVPRKVTISGFTANPTRPLLADAPKSDRNHRITCYFQLGMIVHAISFNAGRISLYAGQISFNDRTHKLLLTVGSGIK